MNDHKTSYEELGRYNSWGTAKGFQKSMDNLDDVRIFKDLTDGPFVSDKEKPYIVVREEKR